MFQQVPAAFAAKGFGKGVSDGMTPTQQLTAQLSSRPEGSCARPPFRPVRPMLQPSRPPTTITPVQSSPAATSSARAPHRPAVWISAQAAAAGASHAAPTPQPGVYYVYTSGTDSHEVVIKTLMGEYVERGMNHERKYYQKIIPEGSIDQVDVFLYYWDSRDGPTYEGWWFGNQLGGSQVWAHSPTAAALPPGSGWKIPWDGQVRDTIVVISKVEQQRKDATEKYAQLSEEVNSLDSAAKQALDEARALAGKGGTSAGLRQAEKLLEPHTQPLTEVQRKVVEWQARAGADTMKQFNSLAQKVRITSTSVSSEIQRVRALADKAEVAEKEQQAEAKDRELLEEMLPEAKDKVEQAELIVTKAGVAAELVGESGDSPQAVQKALLETEAAVKDGLQALNNARVFLTAKHSFVRRFESEKVKAEAVSELAKLQQALQDIQTKLIPLKRVREEYVQRQEGRALVEEIIERMTPAEVACDSAQESMASLEGAEITKEKLVESDAAINKAQQSLARVVNFVQQKKAGKGEGVLAELSKLDERIKESEQQLKQLRAQYAEYAEGLSCEAIIKQSVEKLNAAQEAFKTAADAEAPFLVGLEELPIEDTIKAVRAGEESMERAKTSVSMARIFLAEKLIELKRFSVKSALKTQEEIKEMQTQLESVTTQLTELKKRNAGRKGSAQVREADRQVQEVEALTKIVEETAVIFDDDEKLFTHPVEEVRAAAVNTMQAESTASSALHEARKYVSERLIEAKGRETIPLEIIQDLQKLQARLSAATGIVTKLKKLCATVEQRLATHKALQDVEGAVDGVAKQVDSLDEEVSKLDSAESEGSLEDVQAKGKVLVTIRELMKQTRHYSDAQVRAFSIPRDDVQKSQDRLVKLQAQVDGIEASLRAISEKKQFQALLQEAEALIAECDAGMKNVEEADKAFDTGDEEMTEELAGKAWSSLEAAVEQTTNATKRTRTTLATKRLSAKKFTPDRQSECLTELTRLQAHVDGIMKSLNETKRSMAERKARELQNRMRTSVAEVEQLTSAARDAAQAVGECPEDDLQKVKTACEQANASMSQAQAAISAAKKLLDERPSQQQRYDPEAETDLNDAQQRGEADLMQRVSAAQAELDSLRAYIRSQDQSMKARQTLKAAVDQVVALEAKLQAAVELAEPLNSQDFVAAMHVGQIVDGFKKHCQAKASTPTALFNQFSEGTERITLQQFIAGTNKIPELTEHGDPLFSEKELAAALAQMSPEAATDGLTKAAFLEQFLSKFVCSNSITMTDSLVVRGSKVVRKLEVHEVLEALEEETEEQAGMRRVKARAEKDGKVGYVTIAGNKGAVYLKAYSAFDTCERKVEQTLREVSSAAKQTQSHIDRKENELRDLRTGPWADVKSELNRLRPRITAANEGHSQLLKKLASARNNHEKVVEDEKRRRADAKERRKVKVVMDEAIAALTAIQENFDKSMPAAENIVKEGDASSENMSFTDMEGAEQELGSLKVEMVQAASVVEACLAKVQSRDLRPHIEARRDIRIYKGQLANMEAKCEEMLTLLRGIRMRGEEESHSSLITEIYGHVREKGIDAEQLFIDLSKGGSCVSVEELRKFIDAMPDSVGRLKPVQLDLALRRYAGGMSRMTLLRLLQDYLKCVADVTATTEFNSQAGDLLCKVKPGEVVQALEAPKVEEATGETRLRCRIMKTDQEGWITMKHGQTFLKSCSKPLYYCKDEAMLLQQEFACSSAEAGKLSRSEVVEVIEGPRQEETLQVTRVKIRAYKDNEQGWLTLKTGDGTEALAQEKFVVCKQGVAMTPNFDIGNGKPVRKLEVGEVLQTLEGPQVLEQKQLKRVKARSLKDGKEGWVTMNGNKGTPFLEESTVHYTCRKSVPIERRFPADSAVLRVLEEGEVVVLLDGPTNIVREGAFRMRGKNYASGAEGWFTLTKDSAAIWSGQYTVARAVPLSQELSAGSAEASRQLEEAEEVEALDVPVQDESTGMLRVRIRATRDGAIGFATVGDLRNVPVNEA